MSAPGQDVELAGRAFDLASTELEEAAAKAARIFVEIYRGLEQRPVAPPTDRSALRARIAGTVQAVSTGLRQDTLSTCMTAS